MPDKTRFDCVAEVLENWEAPYPDAPYVIEEYLLLKKEYDRLKDFTASFLDPERNGQAVNGYVRDQARFLLGKPYAEDLKPKT
jgi:hypothetical protein